MTPQELKAQKVALLEAMPGVVLDRGNAVPKLIGRHEDFLIVSGLGGVAHDVGCVTGDVAHVYPLSGAMGAPCMMGLGLALAQPKRQVLVVTGDGDLLMNVSALATIAVMNPPNLAIVCVDNGHYGETGWQKSHTSLGVDLEKIAVGCGIKRTMTVTEDKDLEDASRFIREGNSAGFVLLRVKPTEPPHFKRNFDAAFCRDRFRRNLQSS
jgi:phosphonopyruvate decarboxylase